MSKYQENVKGMLHFKKRVDGKIRKRYVEGEEENEKNKLVLVFHIYCHDDNGWFFRV